MADEIFLEQIVKRKNTAWILMNKISIILAAAVLLLVLSYIDAISVLLPIFAIAVIALAVIIVRRMNIEYEYILAENELDIDAVYSKSSRKSLITIRLNNALKFAPVSDAEAFTVWKEKCYKIKDYSSAKDAMGRYFLVYESEKGKSIIIIEPNEKMLNGIYKVLPRGLA